MLADTRELSRETRLREAGDRRQNQPVTPSERGHALNTMALALNPTDIVVPSAQVTLAAAVLSAAFLNSCGGDSPDRLPQPPELNATATATTVRAALPSPASRTRRGVVAADLRMLPLRSVVRIDALGTPHDGVYHVLDTGSAVK